MSRKKRRPAGSPEPRPARAKAPEADRFRFRLSSPWAVPAILALLTLLYFFDFPLSGKVIYGSDTGTDFHRGKEPFAEKLADYGPGAWKPTLGGYPASEEIRHDYFPTSLLKLFTSYQRHLGWRYMLTVFFAGWGMYRYLRVLSLARWPCLWGAVAFMFAPAFLSFTFAGHYAKMAVIALLPWMFLCLHRGMQEGKLSRFLWLALLIGLGAYTPHVQMLMYALIAVGLYFLFQLYLLYRERREKRTLLARTGLFTLAAALGIGIGSEGLFPSYLHATRESKRAEAATAERTGDPLALARSWSLHPEEVGSLLVPEFAGFYNPQQNRDQYWGRNPGKYNSEYFGIVVLLLAVPALWSWRRNPTAAFMGLLFALALAFTLGGHTPVHWIAAHLLPGGKVLRSVGMAAFLFAFPAIVLAATGLHQALTAGEPEKQLFRKRLLIAAAALGGIGALAAAAPHTVLELWTSVLYQEIAAAKRQIMLSAAPGLSRGGLLALLLCAAAAGLVWALMRHKLSAAAACAGLIALTLADTWRIDRLFLVYEDPARWPDIRLENRRTRQFLESSGERFRVFPLPSHQLLRSPGYHLHGADPVTGFSDFTIRRYDRLTREFDPALSMFQARFSGREIPYSDDDLLLAVRPLLNLVNARWLATPKSLPLQTSRFPEAFSEERLRLYENSEALPWYYLAPAYRLETGEEEILSLLREGRLDPRLTPVLERDPPGPLPAAAAASDLSGDRLDLEERAADGSRILLSTGSKEPRLLVVSENFYPHWRAFVDGEEVPVLRANYVWKAVYLPPGEHRVELRYRSPAVLAARTVTLLCLGAVLLLGIVERRRRPAPAAGADKS